MGIFIWGTAVRSCLAAAGSRLGAALQSRSDLRQILQCCDKHRDARPASPALYHFGLLLLQGAETLPPAHDATLRLHQVAADVVEALLLLGCPEDGSRKTEIRREAREQRAGGQEESGRSGLAIISPVNLVTRSDLQLAALAVSGSWVVTRKNISLPVYCGKKRLQLMKVGYELGNTDYSDALSASAKQKFESQLLG